MYKDLIFMLKSRINGITPVTEMPRITFFVIIFLREIRIK